MKRILSKKKDRENRKSGNIEDNSLGKENNPRIIS
jgi:hypothetical protein